MIRAETAQRSNVLAMLHVLTTSTHAECPSADIFALTQQPPPLDRIAYSRLASGGAGGDAVGIQATDSLFWDIPGPGTCVADAALA